MKRYFEYAILWDFIIAIVFGCMIFFCKPLLKDYFSLPTIENVNGFGVSLITVCATLIGFLLTIITVIVTFKSGFDDKSVSGKPQVTEQAETPYETVFEKKITKENKFYGTEIHKRVVDVFADATYEIGLVLFLLLVMQFNIVSCSVLIISVINTCLFVMILFSIVRSLFIFKLFLNVHLHDKQL